MGDGRRLSAEERREQLMAAAVAVIAESGYGAASGDAIARRAGVSKGLAWHYFADREDLMEATALRCLARVRETVGAGIDPAGPVAETVRDAMRGAARLLTTHPDELEAMRQIVQHLRRPDGTDRFTDDDYDETRRGQEAIFRAAQDRGEIARELDPTVLAVSYQGVVDGMLAYLGAHPEQEVEAWAAATADVFVRGLVSP